MTGQVELCSPDTIGIFVLSEKLGESLVITLPDGKWFVVDAFRGSPLSTDPSPVGHFIDHFTLPVEDCLFVLLTHFHEDHYSGLARLLGHLRRGNDHTEPPHPPFATHPAYRSKSIADKVEKIIALQAEHALPTKKNRGQRIRASEIMRWCREKYEAVAPWKTVYQGRNGADHCRVFAFLPSQSIENRFLVGEAAKKRLKDLVTPVPNQDIRKLMKKQDTILNDMSIGLAIEYGEVCVLLTGDGEKEAWKAASRDPGPGINPHGISSPLPRANFLKAPHHASARAWNPTLKRIYSNSRWAIATHHHRGSYRLPNAKGIKKILDQEVGLAIPDGDLLGKNIPEAWRGQPPKSFRKFTVQGRRSASTERSRRLAESYPGGNVRLDIDELQWVGALFGADNRAPRWLGGSRATFLRKP